MENNELISGSGGKGKRAHTPIEANDTLKSKQVIKLLFAVAEGEIEAISDILLDKVSISSYHATYAWKSGLSNQTNVPGFIDTESPLPTFTSVQLINATYFTYNIDPSVNSVRLTFSLDSLHQILGNGDMVGYTVSLDIYTKATTVSSQVLYKTTTKDGKASNMYAWDVIVERPANYNPTLNWSVVVHRSSADDNSAKLASVTRLVSITQIYHKQLTYPGTALVAITLNDSGEFGGQVPQILIKGKGRKVSVPSNYNPTTRVYTGTWDLAMNSVKLFTDNIAWVLYDVLHDSTCLNIDSADLDKTSFYLLSQYADTLIDDGYGVSIPRYSIGNQFYARDNVPTFIQNLLSLCNGMLTENEFGQIKVIFDQPNISPSRLITNANVVNGLFNYTSNDLENRYSLVNITYNNYLSYNETDTATWSDNSLITRYGLQTSDIVLPGCIYEAQAIRKARWAVYTNAITTKLLTFNVMYEGLSFRNGSVIKVMDSDNAGVTQHGMITATSFAGANTTIVMDRTITLAAQTYTISFYGIDGITLYTKTLLETNVSVSSVSYVGTEVPLIKSTFILSATVVPQLFRVVGNRKDGDEYTISCLTYDNAKFTYIDQSLALTAPTGDFINASSFYAPAVTNLAITPISSSDGINSNIQLYVHWDWDTALTQKYKATFKATWIRDNTDLKEITDITGNSFDINGAVPGTYDITVWAVNPFSGIKSTAATLTYAYRTTAGSSTLLPPVNARVVGTSGLIYTTPALSLIFDYNTLNAAVSDSLLDYVIEFWTLSGSTKSGTYVVKPDSLFGGTFNFPFLENLAIFGASTRSYIIKLYSRDLTGFVSTAYAVTVNNTVPAIQSFTIFSGVSSIYIKVTTTPEIDVTGYQVHRSLTSGFTPGAGTLIYDGADTYITLNVPDTQTYYYKIAAYDSFDKLNLIYSSQQSNTALSLDAITWSTTGLVFGVGTTNQLTWTAGTIVKSGSTTYTIAAGNATWTTGYLYAYFNPAVSTTVIQTTTTLGTAVGVGCYPIATYKGGAVTNIAGGTGSAFISGSQIIAGTVGASQIIAGSIVASNISTTTAVITAEAQIASAVINNAAIKDYIQSSNYSTTAHTGWRLDKTANMITTYGGLQVLDSTGATILSSGTTPTWNWTNVTGTLKPADNATKTFVYSQATVPPTPNEGDVWYVSATLSGYVSGAVYIYKGGAWIRTADATSSQLGGSGVNILDPRFATFEESALPPFSTHASGTLSQDATAKYFGTKSLKIVTTGISGYWNGNTGYTTNIQPNKKWIISGYVYSSTIIAAPVWGTAGIHLGVYTPSAYYGTAGYDGNAAYGTLTIPANTWTRIYGVLDLTADSNTTCLLRLDSHATGTTVWFDGIMLEAQVGNLVTPSVYQEPANFLTTFVGALDATKNTIFRQISAPTGGNYTVGDLWFDTDSNPPAFYNWSGTAWTMVSNAVTNTNQVTDGAALGQTSLWTGVSGTGRPSDNATVGATFGTNINGSITAANVATYISNLAVQTAQIANLAVTTGKIANLAVDTLQIAGNAVIVPVSVFSTSAVGVSLGSFASGWITIATATANLTGGGASSVLRIDSLTGYDPASGSNTANYNNTLFAGQSVRLINVGTGAVLQTLLKGSLMWDTNNNIEIGSISQGSLTIPCNSSITVALQMFVINNLNTPNSDSIVATRSLNLIGAKSSV